MLNFFTDQCILDRVLSLHYYPTFIFYQNYHSFFFQIYHSLFVSSLQLSFSSFVTCHNKFLFPSLFLTHSLSSPPSSVLHWWLSKPCISFPSMRIHNFVTHATHLLSLSLYIYLRSQLTQFTSTLWPRWNLFFSPMEILISPGHVVSKIRHSVGEEKLRNPPLIISHHLLYHLRSSNSKINGISGKHGGKKSKLLLTRLLNSSEK